MWQQDIIILLFKLYQHKIAVKYGNEYEGVITAHKYPDWHPYCRV